jgi:hypothetical protein
MAEQTLPPADDVFVKGRRGKIPENIVDVMNAVLLNPVLARPNPNFLHAKSP